ncbi:MAG: hypothetical protein WD407_00860, partial [Rhodospirillales bacterium]
ERITGARTNLFGTDNQDFMDAVYKDPGTVGKTMFFGLGKMTYDSAKNLEKLGVAVEAGEAGHAFDASEGVSEFVAEIFVDPTLLIGGVGKLAVFLKGADKAADAVRAADKAFDAARAMDDLAAGTTKGVQVASAEKFSDTAKLLDTVPELSSVGKIDGPGGVGSTSGSGLTPPPPPGFGKTASLAPGKGAPLSPRAGPGSAPKPSSVPPALVDPFAPTQLMPPPMAGSAAGHATVPPAAVAAKSPASAAARGAANNPGVKSTTPVDLVRDSKTGDLTLRRADGKQVQLGRTEGEGSFSRAFDVPGTAGRKGPNDMGQVAKLTKTGDSAGALDDLGRNLVEEIGNPGVIQTPKMISEYTVRNSPVVPSPRTGVGPKDFTGGKLAFMEKGPPAFKDLPATMKMADGTMTPGQAVAFNRGMQAINKKGFAWLDNKYDNFTFKPLGDPKADKWVLVVLDPGGMVPVKATKGVTAAEKAANRAENARALQQAADVVPEEAARISANYRSHIHKDVLAEHFDGVVDWDALRKATNNPEMRTLGDLPEGGNKAAHFPYNPSRTGMDSGKLGSLITAEKSGNLATVEEALRHAHKLPENFASEVSGIFRPGSRATPNAPPPGFVSGGPTGGMRGGTAPPPHGVDVHAPTAPHAGPASSGSAIRGGTVPPPKGVDVYAPTAPHAGPAAAGKSFRSAPTEMIPPTVTPNAAKGSLSGGTQPPPSGGGAGAAGSKAAYKGPTIEPPRKGPPPEGGLPAARGRPGRAPEDISILPQGLRGAGMPKKSPATTAAGRQAATQAGVVLGKIDELLKKATTEAVAAGKPVKELNLEQARAFVTAHAGDWPGFNKLTPEGLAAAAVHEQGIKLSVKQLNRATRKTGYNPPPLPKSVVDSPAAKTARAKAGDIVDTLVAKNPKLAEGLDRSRIETYLRNSAGREGNPTPEQIATEALLAQNKRVNIRQLNQAGVPKGKTQALLDKARTQLDNLDLVTERSVKGVLKSADDHLGAMKSARTLLSMRGRAPSFMPQKGQAFKATAAKDASGIAPIGESPVLSRHMVEGDVTHLKSVMGGSGLKPTQNYVHYQKVNQYVQDMLNGKFDWNKLKSDKPGDAIKIGSDGSIQHGHHRVVAAQIVSRLTGRPLMHGPNAVIPDGHWVRATGNLKPSRTPDWNGVGVKPVQGAPSSPRGPLP